MVCNMSTPLTVYETLQIKFPIPLVKWVHVPHEKEGKATNSLLYCVQSVNQDTLKSLLK